jgi:hypothetical protein
MADQTAGKVRARFNLFAEAHIYAPAALVALVAALVCSAILLACNYLSAALPRGPIQAEVRIGFNQRQLLNYG